jgi:MFS family permease
MYLSQRTSTARPDVAGEAVDTQAEPPSRRWLAVGPNVVLLGFTSLVTDVSSEMVGAALPLFLTVRLGLSPLQFGTIDGTVQLVTALAAVVGALLADRWRRHKEVAAAGYGIGALTKLGLLSATSWGPAAAWMAADRAGKGIRTAPRDALIALSAPRQRWGEAFGLHRALDTGGALLGPILAFAILSATASAYDAVFVTGFWVALIGFAVLVLFVDNPARRTGAPVVPPAWRDAARLLVLPRFRSVIAAAGAVSVVTASDSFLFLAFRRRSGLEQRWFPLLFVGTAVVYLVAAVPIGRLADRVSAARVFVIGQLGLVAVYVALSLPSPGRPALAIVLVGLGGYYAATDGVLAALCSHVAPHDQRASALAVVGVVLAAGRAAAAFAFGVSWDRWGPRHTTAVFAVALVVATGVAAWILRHLDQGDSTSGDAPRVAQVG